MGSPLLFVRGAPRAFASCILLYVLLLDDPHLHNGLQSPQRFHGGGGELPGDVQNGVGVLPPGLALHVLNVDCRRPPQVAANMAMVLGTFLWMTQMRRVPGSRAMEMGGQVHRV